MSSTQFGPPNLEAQIFTNKQTLLDKVLNYDRINSPTLHIPHFLLKSFKYIFNYGLNSEGIFRIESSGDNLLTLKKRINEGENVDFEKEKVPVDYVASLVKDFLGTSLNEPLLTLGYEETFYSLKVMEDKDNKLKETFLFLFSKLPESNRAVILEFLNLLVQVDCNKFINMMDAGILSNVLSYNRDMFLRDRKDSSWILKYMIENYTDLFEESIIKNAKSPFILRKLFNHKYSIVSMFNLKNKHVMTVHSDGFILIRDSLNYRFISKISLDLQFDLPPLCIITNDNIELWFALPNSIKIITLTDNNYQKSNEVTLDIPNVQAFAEIENTIWIINDSINVVDKLSKTILNTIPLTSKGTCTYIEYINKYVWYWNDNKYTLMNPQNFNVELEFNITSTERPQKGYYDGENIWLCTINGKILIFDPNTFKIKFVISSHKGPVSNIMHLGPLIISSSYDNKILCWDPSTIEQFGHIPNGHNSKIISIIPIWREEKNGWDLWTASPDSINVLFIPKDFYMYFNSQIKPPSDINGRIPSHLLNENEPCPEEVKENVDNYRFEIYDPNQEDSIDNINNEIAKLREQVFLKEDEMRSLSGFLDKKIQESLNEKSVNISEVRETIQKNHEKEKSLFLEWSELQIKIAVLHNKYRIRVIEELQKESNMLY